MKITFDEILANKGGLNLHHELLNSTPSEVIDSAMTDRFYDVKLIINGIEVEPLLFNKLMNSIEKHIDNEAKNLISEKLQEAENKVMRLDNLVREAALRIREEFGINEDD